MLRGLSTVSFWADDVAAARDWYAAFLGIPAYFQRPEAGTPSYVEFRIGDYQHELGIIDRRYAPHRTAAGAAPSAAAAAGPAGEIVYWHVDDVAATFNRLLAMGAVEYEGVKDRGHLFITASVIDPFGNILGIMQNPHYLEMLAGCSGSS